MKALLLALACRGTPSAEPVDPDRQHPPIPADSPAWSHDAGGFVPDHHWYGEASWDDVRMRVAGHISTAGRDKARVLAEQGRLEEAAGAYADLVRQLDAVPASGALAAEIVGLLRQAARDDAALTAALARGEPPPAAAGGLRALRLKVLAADPAVDLAGDLAPYRRPREDLDLDAFTDFESRHRLRVRLLAASLDSQDPLGLDAPWGYWTAAEVVRQADILGRADELPELPPWRRPSALAERTPRAWMPADFTVEGLGALPTGDSLIDVAGEPGPRAIGRLLKLGLDDPQHRAWLTRAETALDDALARDPASVPSLVRGLVAELDAWGHGSRYYNIKQLRNEAVRQLARAGHPDLALQILATERPLHHQDWACPNREGILEAIEGRLLAEADQPEAALRRLDQSVATAQAFLAQVDAAERRGPPR